MPSKEEELSQLLSVIFYAAKAFPEIMDMPTGRLIRLLRRLPPTEPLTRIKKLTINIYSLSIGGNRAFLLFCRHVQKISGRADCRDSLIRLFRL